MNNDQFEDYMAERRAEFRAESYDDSCINCGRHVCTADNAAYDMVTEYNADGSIALEGAMCTECLNNA